ncbi:MAG: CoA pyrophosphatase [Notoacmeibacter sp.]|nr:CoA pyrophosphatase [Notoacmeibacter sp.]
MSVAGEIFSARDFRDRVVRMTGGAAGDDHGDHLLNPDMRDRIVNAELRDAAVLIPVIDRQGGATVLLTQRTEKLRSHSGQVAFPGGRIDVGDRSPVHAALRETDEEVGLSPGEIEVIGRMPDYVTGSGYRIAPVFGIVKPVFDLKLNPHEVADAFEVPLEFLMSPGNHVRASRFWKGEERFFWEMPHGDRYIWGVTAGIIRTVYERLYAP